MRTASAKEKTSSCSSEAESSSCATSSLSIEEDGENKDATERSIYIASETSSDEENQILPSSAAEHGDNVAESALHLPPLHASTSSNDGNYAREEGEEAPIGEQDEVDIYATQNLGTGSYTISIASVAVGDKVCGVVLPRFSLLACVAFVLGTFLLVFWLTENDA